MENEIFPNTLPAHLKPVAEALVAELMANPLLAGFSPQALMQHVCSSSFRRTLEREHLARQSGLRDL